jgi:adenylate cyclase
MRQLGYAGLAFNAAFYWQDAVLDPVHGPVASHLRVYAAMPICVGLIYCTHQRWLDRYATVYQTVFFAVFATAAIGILLLLDESPFGFSSAVGISNVMVILVAAFSYAHLLFWPSALIGTGIAAVYLAAGTCCSKVAPFDFIQGEFISILTIGLIGTVAAWSREKAEREDFMRARELEQQRQRNTELLGRLVPPAIAGRIQAGEFPIADSHAEVTVMFADVAGFTQLARDLPPRNLVRFLNEVFVAFDEIVERHGVEKIKTIGDGYLAMCGPPLSEDQRPVAAVSAAVEMLAAYAAVAQRHLVENGLRIGIHTGPLVAGVIGRTRFTYDVWGETVNVASRVEATGLPNTIQVSRTCYMRLRGHYPFHERAEVEIKGVGRMTTYLLGREGG